MTLLELKENVLALPANERHGFVVRVNRLEPDYGDVPSEALDRLAAEIWDQDDPIDTVSKAEETAMVSQRPCLK